MRDRLDGRYNGAIGCSQEIGIRVEAGGVREAGTRSAGCHSMPTAVCEELCPNLLPRNVLRCVLAWDNTGLCAKSGKLVAHEKAVPAMIGKFQHPPNHEGTASVQGKEATQALPVREVPDSFDAAVSHAGGFQASAKRDASWEDAPLGCAPLDPCRDRDDVVLRRQPARAIRGGTRVLCRFLWEAQASRDLGAGIRAGAAKTPHARVAQLGSSDSPPRANAFRRPTAGGRIYSLRLRRHAQESPRSEELERRLGTFGKEGSAP